MKWTAIAALVLAGVAAGCEPLGPPPFEDAVTLGGVSVEAATLNQGRRTYTTYCRACHGPNGDGNGPLGHQQRPQARDLRGGIIKFAGVESGGLPRDEDLARVIRRGLPGTAMLPWDVPDEELDAVVQYVKTFAPRWRSEGPGRAIVATANPWPLRDTGGEAEAARRGADLYHGTAGCASCHPAYRDDAPAAAAGEDRPDPRPIFVPRQTESVYGPIAATELRDARLRGGDLPEDLYRVIAAGVGGTAMATWKGALSEEDLWALVHYIRALRDSNRAGNDDDEAG